MLTPELAAVAAIRNYLGTITPEQADRVLQAEGLCGDWYELETGYGCLVMTAECSDLRSWRAQDRAHVRMAERYRNGDALWMEAANSYPTLVSNYGRDVAFQMVKGIIGERNAPPPDLEPEAAPREPPLGLWARTARRLDKLAMLFL